MCLSGLAIGRRKNVTAFYPAHYIFSRFHLVISLLFAISTFVSVPAKTVGTLVVNFFFFFSNDEVMPKDEWIIVVRGAVTVGIKVGVSGQSSAHE